MKTRSLVYGTTLFCVVAVLVAALPSFAQNGKAALVKDSQVPTLGTGNVKVRFYTDYFCAPCRVLEPKIEPIIVDLLKRNAVTITFIDAPFHKHSALYAQYFLFIHRERKESDYLLKARNVLFEASKQRTKEGAEIITDAPALEEVLGKNFIIFRRFDVTPVFNELRGLLMEDKINQTPTCVIINNGKKETYKGGADIMKALSAIK
jgi:hypothetical protein